MIAEEYGRALFSLAEEMNISESVLSDLTVFMYNYFYTLDEELFKQTMETLSAGAAELDVKHTETNFSGKVTVADGRNILMLTMPYDENINVIANGEKCDVIRIGGIFAGVKLPDGEYEFEVNASTGALLRWERDD